MTHGLFPLCNATTVITTAGASAAVTGLTPGVLYRVIGDVASNLQYGAAATATTGLRLAANEEYYFMFGAAGTQPIDVRVFAAVGHVYFTPCYSVSS